MKQIYEMPNKGQFVIVFTCRGEVWSGTYRIADGELLEYDMNLDDWVDINPYFKGDAFSNLTYFIKE